MLLMTLCCAAIHLNISLSCKFNFGGTSRLILRVGSSEKLHPTQSLENFLA